MKLSIILPTYNVDLYLEECINSIINQDINKDYFEIIIINDGSNDNSLKIAYRLANQNSSIRIINKENGGVSSARNIGINHAKGEYIFFLDPDDALINNTLNSILEYITNDKSDCFLIKQLRTDNKLKIKQLSKSEKYYFTNIKGGYKGEDILKNIILLDFPYRLIVKKDFLISNYIYFNEKLSIFEDVLFALNVYINSNIIKVIDQPIYLYRIHKRSSVYVTKENRSNQIEKCLKNLSIVLEEINSKKYIKQEKIYTQQTLLRRYFEMSHLHSAKPLNSNININLSINIYLHELKIMWKYESLLILIKKTILFILFKVKIHK